MAGSSARGRAAVRNPYRLLAGLAVVACSDAAVPAGEGGFETGSFSCTIPTSEIFDGGVGRDGIPALTDPPLVPVGHADAEYLRDADRVIGVEIAGATIAVPHNVGWWHEIVNLSVGGRKIAVTLCPLTGSSLAFDRAAVEGAEFGVSGLLFRNNLIMYDRRTNLSLWPQMMRSARCGPASGVPLPMYPALEMTWEGWRTLHPDTKVIGERTGLARSYRFYPYGDYERIDNGSTLFPMPSIDPRRAPKERVLGVPAGGDGGIAFPYLALEQAGSVVAAEAERDGKPIVVFWEGRRQGAAAYSRALGGETLSFAVRDGRIVDVETGSVWRLDGRAAEGPLKGRQLEPVSEAYVAFWFAWASFQPETKIWESAP
ncbi:MAG: DUF3179 domain-containing protein [Gemmatimonadetes bacterium]|nr:DUF3179 domain-containing protein [Gemmatimonadota bacterium]